MFSGDGNLFHLQNMKDIIWHGRIGPLLTDWASHHKSAAVTKCVSLATVSGADAFKGSFENILNMIMKLQGCVT